MFLEHIIYYGLYLRISSSSISSILTHTIHQAWEVHNMKLSDILSKLSVVRDEMLQLRYYQHRELSSEITSETMRSLLLLTHIF